MSHYSRLHELDPLPPVDFSGATNTAKALNEQSVSRLGEHYSSIDSREALDVGELFNRLISNSKELEGVLGVIARAVQENRDRLNLAITVFKYEIYEIWEVLHYHDNELSRLDGLLVDLAQQINSLETEVTNNQNSINSLQQGLQSVQGLVNNVTNSLSSIQSNTSSNTGNLNTIQNTLIQLESRIQDLESAQP
jgi:chromosome segregation ATPase